jgi:choline monooxygenase
MLDATLLHYFDAAGAVAHGLPGEAYTSDSFMQLEHEQLFANHWVFVGYAHQLAQSGDVKPIQVGGLPLFVLRDQQGRIVVFHNVCRHRQTHQCAVFRRAEKRAAGQF